MIGYGATKGNNQRLDGIVNVLVARGRLKQPNPCELVP